MKKLEKTKTVLNEKFRQIMPAKFYEKFGIEILTTYDFFSGVVVSTRVDSADFTEEQWAFVCAFEEGYAAAMAVLDDLIGQGG